MYVVSNTDIFFYHRTENYREVEKFDPYARMTSALRPVVRLQYIHFIAIQKGVYISSNTTYFCRRMEKVEITVTRESLKRLTLRYPWLTKRDMPLTRHIFQHFVWVWERLLCLLVAIEHISAHLDPTSSFRR